MAKVVAIVIAVAAIAVGVILKNKKTNEFIVSI